MIRIILPDRMGGIVYHLRGTVPVSQHVRLQGMEREGIMIMPLVHMCSEVYASVFVCVEECYSCSMINDSEVQVRASIGF